MKDLTIIIPLKEYNESVKKELDRAIDSCGENSIILIGKNLDEYKSDHSNLTKVNNDSENDSYQHNVNFAVDMVTTKYFSVLEYDDMYSKNWFHNVEEHIKYDGEGISGFLPLTEVIDYDRNTVIGYSNEAFWASSTSEKIGYLDMESLQNYYNFNTSGAVFKTDDFISNGKLKESMKIVFWLEYLLRSLHENKIIYVIPKVGYFHFVGRKGSMTEEYMNTISEKEVEWWIDLAKKEYFFKKDRNKTFEE